MAPVERQRKLPDLHGGQRKLPDFHLHALRLEGQGSRLFFQHVVDPYSVLRDSSERVLDALYPRTLEHAETEIPPIRTISLLLAEIDGVAYTKGSDLDNDHKEIVLSTKYLESVYENSGKDSKRLKHEIEGVLTHEIVHVFQYDGEGSLPGGVIEGIADWVRNEAHLGPPHWTEAPGAHEKWDAGYQTT
ncbi:uncharacterized protein JCM6883_003820 [Sporobolomyces salmoneus]|uniref:uncharacterized protein n=1 Tax=Sporobolomyces salmoneus TaxID=183962 RepID=UPI003180891E